MAAGATSPGMPASSGAARAAAFVGSTTCGPTSSMTPSPLERSASSSTSMEEEIKATSCLNESSATNTSPPIPVSVHHCGPLISLAIHEWSDYNDLSGIMSPSTPGEIKLDEESMLGSSEIDAPPGCHLSNSSAASSTSISINSRMDVSQKEQILKQLQRPSPRH
ncbi:hypothetical protein MLD38_024046 [Melastoma candidum]|uniref:Uncharacterized protein n=1 Tax=Melastoma candidum TaxID=119954 RepID=A0ACB9NU21_9MYRT|nr:hypothetical protein MLD38_024046 [Melastoma candidum]